jgi:hypothetical protein
VTLAVWILAALLGAVSGGCATLEVQTEFDPRADFSGFETWVWMPREPPATGDPRLDNAILHSRIRAVVEEQLALQGFRKLASGTPDFLVSFHAAIDQRLDVSTVDRSYPRHGGGPYGGAGRWGGGWVHSSETRVREYELGSLILDIADNRTRDLVWRGFAQAEVGQRSQDQARRDERLREAVRRMLEQFPPKPDGS